MTRRHQTWASHWVFIGLATLALLQGAGIAFAEESAPKYPVPFDLIEDVVYGHKDGLALTMDIMKPRKGCKNIGIILVSSGGWRSGKSTDAAAEERRRQTEHWVQGLLGGGYTLFIARHGSTPRYFVPEMVEDIRRSVRFVRHHAKKYEVDPERLGITSGSSGGHLALMVGLTGDEGDPSATDPVDRTSSRVQSIVAWFAPTDLVNFGAPEGYRLVAVTRPGLLQSLFPKIENLPEQLRSISPIEQISSDDPPVLLIHGDKDKTVPLQQSEIFAEKYRAAGKTVELIVQPGGGHTYWEGILDVYPAVWKWFDRDLAPQE